MGLFSYPPAERGFRRQIAAFLLSGSGQNAIAFFVFSKLFALNSIFPMLLSSP
jgi:hypothetical protein